MNEEQQAQLIAFVANFTAMLLEGSASRDQAQLVLEVGVSCLIATVFKISQDYPEAAEVSDFARGVIHTSLRHFYDKAKVPRSVPLHAW